MVWAGIQPGEIKGIIHPADFTTFLHSTRSIFPLFAGYIALILIFVKFYKQCSDSIQVLGPLGLTALYGLIGTIATVFSPSWSVALYHSSVYLSVPAVLFFVGLNPYSEERIGQVIKLNSFLITSLTVLLFFIALFSLNLGGVILTPSTWIDCDLDGTWYHNSWSFISSFPVADGLLRPTGIGRYAGLTALLALGGLFQRRWTVLWATLLFGSLMVLLTSEARTAIAGFLVAASVIVLLYKGKQAVIVGLVALVVILPLAWSTGASDRFIDNCVFHGAQSERELRTQVPPIIDAPLLPKTPETAHQIQALIPPTVIPKKPLSPSTTATDLRLPENFFKLTGRTEVWKAGIDQFLETPILGIGFNADRLALGAHMHNSYLQALIQTGLLGSIPFVTAIIYTWILLWQLVRNINEFPPARKHMVIQSAGVLAFLSVRTITESTGAFFGVDWLLLAPIFLYLQIVRKTYNDYEFADQVK